MVSEFVRERMGAYFCFIYIVVVVVVCDLIVERIACVLKVCVFLEGVLIIAKRFDSLALRPSALRASALPYQKRSCQLTVYSSPRRRDSNTYKLPSMDAAH